MNEPLSDEELEAIERRCSAALPGPWQSIIEGRDQLGGSSFIMTGPEHEHGEDLYLSTYDHAVSDADHDFIAAARQDVPRLLAEVRRLRQEKQSGNLESRMTGEVEQLRAELDRVRSVMLQKVAGLSDADARRSTVASGTSLAGLLQHLTYVESKWFQEVAGGGGATRGKRSMTVDPDVSIRTLRAEYRDACAASDAIISQIADAETSVTHRGTLRNFRWVLLSAIHETARHAGHADIIREQIDAGS